MQYKHFLLFLLSTLLLISCGKSFEHQEFYEIQSGDWTWENKAVLNIPIEDTLKIYNLYLELDHSTSFSNQNLYIKIDTKFPSGKTLEETLSIELASKSGQWLGDCNKERCTFILPIQEGAFFSEKGVHNFTIQQYMRTNPVGGVFKIGLLLEATEHIREQ